VETSSSITCLPTFPALSQGKRARHGSFTLVEMLVAMAVLAILMLLAFQMISQTSGIWISSNSKMSQSREARVAFNSIVLRLSQATVDQYYGYEYQNVGTASAVTNIPTYPIIRRSELGFISGVATNILSGTSTAVLTSANCPAHAVFFVAPLGIVKTTATYGHLPSLLNVCGYYIQWSNKDLDCPYVGSTTFAGPLPATAASANYRFRLMQFVQPSEYMSVYSQTIPFSASNTNGNYAVGFPSPLVTPPAWQITALNNSPTTGGISQLAKNVIGLFLLPAMSSTDGSGGIAPGFLYNSQTVGSPGPATTSVNRVPPVMRVVMYTIDEKSAQTLSASYGSTMPTTAVYGSLFTAPSQMYPNLMSGTAGDVSAFEKNLKNLKLRFRRFDAAIQMPAQPWNIQN
jgi:uncharacterized protein (TIGR02599 family)